MDIKAYPQLGVAVTCRSFEEYIRMFNLSQDLLKAGPILDIASGASSFTAEARSRNLEAYAVDPQYSQSPAELICHAGQEIETSTNKLKAVQEQYDWSFYGSIDEHKSGRKQSLQKFAEHYGAMNGMGDSEGEQVYYAGAFPVLPFPSDKFSLVLCSHFLFLYQDQFDESFHQAALDEMFRVCRPGGEVRIYPLLSLRFTPYTYLETLIERLESQGAILRYEETRLPFIPGSSPILVVTKPIHENS